MNKSESIKELAAALVKAQVEVKSALKESTNPHFRSKYADLASVVEAVKQPLLKQGISFLQGIHDAVDGVAVETMLLHTSGEWISSTLRIPATKQDAQGYGSAITYGRRYGLMAICGVPAEDDDGNAAAASTGAASGTETPGVHKPTDGAMQRVAPSRRPIISKTATEAKNYLKEDKDWDAFALCTTIKDADEKAFLWTFFDSKERSRIKTQQEASKEVA